MFISVTGVTPDNKIRKYQPFDSESEATAHAVKYDGFVAERPLGHEEYWIVDPVAKTVTRDVAAEEANWEARVAQEGQRSRRKAYRDEADPLFFEEQAGEVSDGTWAAKRAEIKERFPK